MPPVKYQCNGITTKGLRCKMKCDIPNGYCKYHYSQNHPITIIIITQDIFTCIPCQIFKST